MALATVMPAMATAAGGRPTAAGGRAAGRAASARSDASGSVSPAVLASLSPQQLAGQRVIYSYSGLTPPACCALIILLPRSDTTFGSML